MPSPSATQTPGVSDVTAPHVTAAADRVLQDCGIFRNPYFAALSDGTMELPCFRRGQEQFFHAVKFFPRPMAALVARISDPAARLAILHNLVEEHGDFNADHFHARTFALFLQRIGGRSPEEAGVAIAPAVHAFNSVLMSACAYDELDVGVGCMGIIERAFASISALIGAAAVDRGWVPRDALVHYTLHAELDLRHADEFFRVVEPLWGETASRQRIECGLRLGAYAFDQLYRSMLQSRTA